MVVLELDRVEVDHCLVCGGLWLDAGELELLAGTPDKATALAILFRDLSDTAGKRRAPARSAGRR